MATDILSTDFDRLRLKTKTVGADRIKRAKDNNEDIAVLSMFLPGATAAKENATFRCHLGIECRLGDCRDTTPGTSVKYKSCDGLYTRHNREIGVE